MTCMEAQSSITAFINDEMDIAELEEFIEHIRTVRNVWTSLMFIMLFNGYEAACEDRNLSDDFSGVKGKDRPFSGENNS